MRGVRTGFTLIELIVVVGIMGLMGTISVGGYRAMRRGIEERGVVQNVSEFVKLGYARAIVDRQPVKLIFWNETVRTDDDDDGIRVLGHCVAVRRMGRISRVDGSLLEDEFGDLSDMRYVDSDGKFDPDDKSYEKSSGMTIYRMRSGESGCKKSVVGSTTAFLPSREPLMSASGKRGRIPVYAYYVKDGSAGEWKAGDAYGFEFADLTLAQNYIIGSSYQNSLSNPETTPTVIDISPNGDISPSSVQVYVITQGKSGGLETKRIGASENPTGDFQ